MEYLKTYFPLSFKYAKDLANLIIGIILYVVLGAVGGAVIGIFSGIAIIGIFASILGGLLSLYCLSGIVILVLSYLKLLK